MTHQLDSPDDGPVGEGSGLPYDPSMLLQNHQGSLPRTNSSNTSSSRQCNDNEAEAGDVAYKGSCCIESDRNEVTASEFPGEAIPSIVAETMKRVAPYGLVQNANWALPTSAYETSGALGARRRLAPILHSLQNVRLSKGSKGGQRTVKHVKDKPAQIIHQSSHPEASPPKHANILYETFVKTTTQPGQRHSRTSPEVKEELLKLLAFQEDSVSGAAHNQDLDDTGHADLSKIKTEQDAVAFFARHGSTTKTKFLYCNRMPTDPLEFEPYKLVVVPFSQVNPEHFAISATAVMHICPGKPSECFRQDEWMRQAFVHSALRSLPFFKTFVARKVLFLWSHASRRHGFAQKREMLCRTLFMAKPIYCEHLVQIHRVLAGVSSAKLVELQPTLYDISQFISEQNTLRSDPKTGTGKELEVGFCTLQGQASV